MSEFNLEAWEDAVLTITSGQAWETVRDGLTNEIYACQAAALEQHSWDKVCELRGYAQGLAFILNLRENTILAKKQREAEAKVYADV